MLFIYAKLIYIFRGLAAAELWHFVAELWRTSRGAPQTRTYIEVCFLGHYSINTEKTKSTKDR